LRNGEEQKESPHIPLLQTTLLKNMGDVNISISEIQVSIIRVWSPILREEDGMFENRFLRKILGPKKDEVAEGH
jgi:hypothetical protein